MCVAVSLASGGSPASKIGISETASPIAYVAVIQRCFLGAWRHRVAGNSGIWLASVANWVHQTGALML